MKVCLLLLLLFEMSGRNGEEQLGLLEGDEKTLRSRYTLYKLVKSQNTCSNPIISCISTGRKGEDWCLAANHQFRLCFQTHQRRSRITSLLRHRYASTILPNVYRQFPPGHGADLQSLQSFQVLCTQIAHFQMAQASHRAYVDNHSRKRGMETNPQKIQSWLCTNPPSHPSSSYSVHDREVHRKARCPCEEW